MRRALRSRGQASVEALALVPILVGVVLLVWQLAVLAATTGTAQDRVGEKALTAPGEGGRTTTVRVSLPAPGLLPGLDRLRVPVQAAVRAP